jgi:hypothetical protein
LFCGASPPLYAIVGAYAGVHNYPLGGTVLERSVEAIFARRVRDLGGESWKFAPVCAGNPDRIVLMPGGGVFLVELKAPGGRLSPIQRLWHARAEKLGTVVQVVEGALEARSWLPPVVDQTTDTK